jgi:phosphoglycolate phosphatase
MTPTVVLFDIDGTLLTCGGAGRRALMAAARRLWGRDDVFDFSFGGRTDRSIAREAHRAAGVEPTPASIDALLEAYLRELEAAVAAWPGFRVLDGAAAVVDRARAVEGTAVGLGTGNLERGARIKLRRAGLDDRFAFGGFGCDDEDRARLLDAGARKGAAQLGRSRDAVRVLVIGDTPRDVEAARAIGAEVVAVTTGHYDAEVLRGADEVVDRLPAPALLRRLRA